MSKKVISQKPLSLPEVKEILEQREGSLDSLQLRVLEYTRKYSKLSSKDAEELIEELVTRFELTREEAVQIADICPTHVEELRSILSGYKRLVSFLLFSEDKLKAIIDTVKKFLKEDLQE
ncbi:MAG: RNA polymerase Rpb4 family protein [Candidatus Caldarchaeales archaeon]